MKVVLPICVLLILSTSIQAKETALFVAKSKKKCATKLTAKTFTAACTDKAYRGAHVFRCEKSCPKDTERCAKPKWRSIDRRLCHQDGRKKGIYVNKCNGKPLDAKTLLKACALTAAKGKTAVRCHLGKETKRLACASARNTDGKRLDTKVFIEKCGGKVAKKARGKDVRRNLKTACRVKDYKGQTLVRCASHCTQRKGLKCTQRTWKEKKRVACNDVGKTVNLKNCNEEQGKEIAEARTMARKRLKKVIASMTSFLERPDLFYKSYGKGKKRAKKLQRRDKAWVRKALDIARKTRKKIAEMPSKYICQGNSGYCGKGGANAHTMSFERHHINFCNGYLKMEVDRKAAVLAHEISHNYSTDDLEYDRSKIKDVEWWNNAETYEMWVEKQRLCIPGFDC